VQHADAVIVRSARIPFGIERRSLYEQSKSGRTAPTAPIIHFAAHIGVYRLTSHGETGSGDQAGDVEYEPDYADADGGGPGRPAPIFVAGTVGQMN
jgi:hypothetical protein